MQENYSVTPRLTVLSDQRDLGSDFAVEHTDSYIGRSPECEIVIAHPTVSGRHARIFKRDDSWFIEDLHSTNGTAVNHRAIYDAVMLRPGDVIQVGEVHLLYQQEGETGAQTVIDAPPPMGADVTGVYESSSEFNWQPGDPLTAAPPAGVPAPDNWSSSAGPENQPAVPPAAPPAGGGLDLNKPRDDAPHTPTPVPMQSYFGDASPGDFDEAPPLSAPLTEDAGPAMPPPGPSAAETVNALSDARSRLASLAERITGLQQDVLAFHTVTDTLEAALTHTEQDRDTLASKLQSLNSAVSDVATSTENRAQELEIEKVLKNLDGLIAQPNDLALLVNVSRDASQYASLVRLGQEVAAKLRAIQSPPAS